MTQPRDREALLVLGVALCFLYAYFYQGGGWNQNSHFDTVRAIVEGHTVEITPLASNTGDVGYQYGKVYSNKGPGLALWMTPLYFVLYRMQLPVAPGDDVFLLVSKYAHALTFLAAGVPAVALVLVLYLNFRRKHATVAESFCLAAAFGTGSLIFPYSGVMMSHVFTTFLLFASWHLLTQAPARVAAMLLAGSSSAFAVVTDQLALPVAGLFLIYALLKAEYRATLGFASGAGLIASFYLAYNKAFFGSIFLTHQLLESHQFQNPALLLGMLHRPDPLRLFLLTVHPYRGLFYCCPVMLLPLLSWRRPLALRRLTLEEAIPLLVISFFVLFNLSFNGWDGGWAVGPRYLIPMLPFMFSFALLGLRRSPRLAVLLAVLSAFLMFSVAAVRLMVPTPSYGNQSTLNPVVYCVNHLLAGDLSISAQSILDYVPVRAPRASWASYNLGELFGLHGLPSLVPALIPLLALAVAAVALQRRDSAAAASLSSASTASGAST